MSIPRDAFDDVVPRAPHRECPCYTCDGAPMIRQRMYLCALCGNKRCPHATDHRYACTNSNEPDQPGSNY